MKIERRTLLVSVELGRKGPKSKSKLKRKINKNLDPPKR
jgi:hypothetical protein